MQELKRRFFLLTSLIYSVVIIALLLVVALMISGGVWQIVSAVGLLIVIGWLLYSPSIGFPPAMVLTDEKTFPALDGLIGRIAAEIDTPPPPIMLTNGHYCALGLIGWRQRPLLILSQPFLLRATDEERIALIAHEIGHLRDDAFTRATVHQSAYGVLVRFLRVMAIVPFGEVLASPVRRCKTHINRIRQVDSYQSELNADRWSARIAGNAAVRQMLRRLANESNSQTHPASRMRLDAIDALQPSEPTIQLTRPQSSALAMELLQWPYIMQQREAHVHAESERDTAQSGLLSLAEPADVGCL